MLFANINLPAYHMVFNRYRTASFFACEQELREVACDQELREELARQQLGSLAISPPPTPASEHVSGLALKEY